VFIVYSLKKHALSSLSSWEELHEQYSSPSIVRGDKIEKNEMDGHVARMGRGEACTGYWLGNVRERDHWKDPGVEGSIILRWIFNK
jgi:hypothetical protein